LVAPPAPRRGLPRQARALRLRRPAHRLRGHHGPRGLPRRPRAAVLPDVGPLDRRAGEPPAVADAGPQAPAPPPLAARRALVGRDARPDQRAVRVAARGHRRRRRARGPTGLTVTAAPRRAA